MTVPCRTVEVCALAEPVRNALAQASHSPILEILKKALFGINAALTQPICGSGLVDAIKQQRKQNSMLNKLNKRRGGFTLVEIMIVVAIIALLAAIAVPGFLRARKRSQASRIINDLRLIDSAVPFTRLADRYPVIS